MKCDICGWDEVTVTPERMNEATAEHWGKRVAPQSRILFCDGCLRALNKAWGPIDKNSVCRVPA